MIGDEGQVEVATAPSTSGTASVLEADGRWMLIAATSRGDTQRFADQNGFVSPLIVDKYDLVRHRTEVRSLTRDHAIAHVAIHTLDWSRETEPQLYLAALTFAASATPEWNALMFDEKIGTARHLKIGHRVVEMALAPFQLVGGLAQGGREIVRFATDSKRPMGPLTHSGRRTGEQRHAVLAIWLNDRDVSVGGAVTHIKGILRAFRGHGLRVGLVVTSPPPQELAGAFDDLEIADPLPSTARVMTDLHAIVRNQAIRDAATRLSARLHPEFVYQRHAPFLIAGTECAADNHIPLVLEWNASEEWVYRNWASSAKPFRRPFGRLLAVMERRAVGCADLIAAVSERAADMACAAGADRARVVVVPNAVDIAEVQRATASRPGLRMTQGALIGWVGSFGEWHGADLLVRCMPHLSPDINLLMVGEGRTRPDCERLAVDLGVSDRICWTGRLPHFRALELLACCDVVAAPHTPLRGGESFFGSPTKIFEYMAIGRPIVASRLGQIADVLEDGYTARLVTPGDVRELTAAIIEVVRNPTASALLGDAARREAEAHHSWDRRAATILESLALR